MNVLNKYNGLISLLILSLAVIWSFSAQLPSAHDHQTNDPKKFSQQNALKHLKIISSAPHAVGTSAHEKVRKYLVSELKKLGLEVETFEQLSTDPHRWISVNTKNIIAKINGSTKGKGVALVSHYDSSTLSSYGASDAGSGVVTILEGIRAFLANGQQPKNDIFIIFTDAEEQGLLGAGAFVNFHPWSKDISLVLNFEARGTGGSSYMVIETNGGNKKLIQAFKDAEVDVPVANSLMYAVYKSLPNDTDLTVFREQGNIDGYNFAFIDDHFDYHTAQDNYDRIDRESLNHQANYLIGLLNYFAFSDISQLKSDEEMVYFNFPGLDMVIYPNSWVMVFFALAVLLFVALTIYGLKQKQLTFKGISFGFIPLILSLVIAGVIGHFGWQLLLGFYPQYAEIPQGFTYNGHWIIVSFISITGAASVFIYRVFSGKQTRQDLFVGPIVLWLIINLLVAIKLPGAGFFIIPVFLALACFALMNKKELASSKLMLLTTLLSLPSIMILAPLIPMFVVGLGLKMLIIATLLTLLTLILILPIFVHGKLGKRLIIGFVVLSVVFLLIAHTQSDYTEQRKKPNSVNYLYDQDSNKAFLFSYNRVLDDFTDQFFNQENRTESWNSDIYPDNRRVKIHYSKQTEKLNLKGAIVEVLSDEMSNDSRTIAIQITPQRPTNNIKLASLNHLEITKLTVNGQTVSKNQKIMAKVTVGGFFYKYVLSDLHETITLELTVPNESELALKVYETTFDLFDSLPNIQTRTPVYMPEPFVTTDTTIISQSIKIK